MKAGRSRRRRNAPDDYIDPVELWKHRTREREDRVGRRVSPEAARRRPEAHARYVQQMGTMASAEVAGRLRELKALQKSAGAFVGVTVKRGTCKGKSGPCCRKHGGKFARCGPGAREDFCFRSDRPCCRNAATGRFITCKAPALVQDLQDAARRVAGDERNRASKAASREAYRLKMAASNPPARSRSRDRGRLPGPRIYPQVIAVLARKVASDRAPVNCSKCGAPNGGDLFMHRFIEAGQLWPRVPVVGLPDGSVALVAQGARLWGRR